MRLSLIFGKYAFREKNDLLRHGTQEPCRLPLRHSVPLPADDQAEERLRLNSFRRGHFPELRAELSCQSCIV